MGGIALLASQLGMPDHLCMIFRTTLTEFERRIPREDSQKPAGASASYGMILSNIEGCSDLFSSWRKLSNF